MKTFFQKIADEIGLKMTYANSYLANFKLDDLKNTDFNSEGLTLLISPIYAGVGVDEFHRMQRPFEISVISKCDLDFEDSEIDPILVECEKKLRAFLKGGNLTANTMNIFVDKFDLNLCGVFANISVKSKTTVCYE